MSMFPSMQGQVMFAAEAAEAKLHHTLVAGQVHVLGLP